MGWPDELQYVKDSNGNVVGLVNGSNPLALFTRTSPIRLGVFGDSLATYGTNVTDTQLNSTPHPASGATTSGFSADKLAVLQFHPKIYPVANGGISGETTTSMLARESAGYSTTRKAITDVVALNPDVVILRAGINDLIGGATVAATHANRVAIIQRFLSAGVIVIDEGVFGYSGLTGLPNTIRANLLQCNALAKAYAATLAGKVYFLDTRGSLHGDDGHFLSGVANIVDGVHLNRYGAYILAQQEYTMLSNIFGTPTGPRYPGRNKFTNEFFTATGAVASGTLATGVTLSNLNSTVANTQIEIIDNKIYQTTQATLTGAAANVGLKFVIGTTALKIAAGDIYGFEFDYYVENMSGATLSPDSIFGRLDIYKTSNGRVVQDALATGSPADPVARNVLKGKIAFQPHQFQDASAALDNAQSAMYFTYTTSINDGSTIKIGISNPRIVKLNENHGVAVLVGGTATVSHTSFSAFDKILVTSIVDGGTVGFLRVSAKTAGTSFTITSSSGTDTSTVAWQVVKSNTTEAAY